MKRFFTFFITVLLFGTFVFNPEAFADNSRQTPLKPDGTKYKIFIQDVRLVGLDSQYSAIYGAFIAAAIRELDMYDIITSKDLSDLIDYENLKDVLACDSVSCLADIGGVALADYMLTSNISKFPDSYALALTLSDVNTLKQVGMATEMLSSNSSVQLNNMLTLKTKSLFAKYLTEKEQLELTANISRLKNNNQATKPYYSSPSNNNDNQPKNYTSPAMTTNTPKYEVPQSNSTGYKYNNVDPQIKKLKNGAIITCAAGSLVLAAGIPMAAVAAHKKKLFLKSYFGDTYQSEKNKQNALAVSGTVALTVGGVLELTAIILGVKHKAKSKKQVAAIPTIDSNGVQLNLAYTW